MEEPSATVTAQASDCRSEFFQNLFQRKPKDFLALLDRNIASGGAESGAAKAQLEVVAEEQDIAELLLRHRNDDGDTLAHTAAKFHKTPAFLTRLFDLSPGLLMETRIDDYVGQTPLHIIISKGSCRMARAVLEHPYCVDHREEILRAKAVGSKFKNTVMMGQLPLSVAALTLKKKMTTMLIYHGADISWRNEDKDTVFHSLIRFANVHSDKLNDILDMMRHINLKLPPNHTDVWHRAKNKDKLTPLKLAASLGLVEIFSAILELDGVYRSLNSHDGLFDIHLYDVTEIDTVTQAEWERYHGSLRRVDKKIKKETCQIWCPLMSQDKKPSKHSHDSPSLKHKAPAVLDIVCMLPVRQAFDFIRVEAVSELVALKWNHYRWFFGAWSIYHFCIMIHLTFFAIYKTEYLNSIIYPEEDISQSGRNFVNVTGGFALVYACIYLGFELIRTLFFRQAWQIRLIQHNGMYRFMLLVFSLSLVIDIIWFYSHPHNNYFLILALLLGWTFMAFFLRTWKRFSFYTVMFQKVLLGDMTRLSVIIAFQLIAFSIAIYTTFLNTKPAPDGFNNAGVALMTMFKLMLGLTDIEVLYDAREPWLAIVLYIGFVLVTYVLLINSLIAMMSRTCDLISEDRNRQWELQRLSVILLIETMLLPRWRYIHKAGIKAIRRYGLHTHEYRCYIEITSVQSNYMDGNTVLQRKSLINTIGFGKEGGMSLLAPIFRSVGSINRKWDEPTSTYMRRSGLRYPAIKEEDTDGDDDAESKEDVEDDFNGGTSDDESEDGVDMTTIWGRYNETIDGQTFSPTGHESTTGHFETIDPSPPTQADSLSLTQRGPSSFTHGDRSSLSREKKRRIKNVVLAGSVFQQRPIRPTKKPQDDARDVRTDNEYKVGKNHQFAISSLDKQLTHNTLETATTATIWTDPRSSSQPYQQKHPPTKPSFPGFKDETHGVESKPSGKFIPSLRTQSTRDSQTLSQRGTDFQWHEDINPVKVDDKILHTSHEDDRKRFGETRYLGELLKLTSEPFRVEASSQTATLNTLYELPRSTQPTKSTPVPNVQEIDVTFLDSSA